MIAEAIIKELCGKREKKERKSSAGGIKRIDFR